jgi:PAS domain S-box-containing protein
MWSPSPLLKVKPEMHLSVETFSKNEHLEFYNLAQLIEEQGRILEMIPAGKNLSQILQSIVLWAEKESKGGLLASILLMDEKGEHLLHGAAPSLPAPYNEAIHGVKIGPGVGSCGTAAFTGESVIVEDIESDPLWKDFRGLALRFGLRACWSTPLIGRKGNVLGTFAMYYTYPNKPTSHDLQVIRLISSTAVLAIEWENATEERERLLENERKANENIKEERQKLFHLLMDAPALVAVMSGPSHVFELANDLYLEIVGRRNILGKPIREAMPELSGQGILELLDNVYATGKPFYGNEILIQLQREDKLEGVYFNFVYQAIKNEKGVSEGIFVHAVNVTELVKAKYRALESEEMFRSFVLNSPTPIGIYVGKKMKVQTANDAMLKVWEKDKTVIGKTLRQALPELDGQPFHQLLDDVYTTGITYQANEDIVYLMRDGKLSPTYFNFTYKALRNEKGEIYGVINTATEVTDMVLSKQRLAEAQETLKSAIDIAELGTWTIHLTDNYVTYSESIADWFGLPVEGASLTDVIGRMFEQDRRKVEEAVNSALTSNGLYEAEYRVMNPYSGRERIIHAKGTMVLDKASKQTVMNGVCRDITMQKQIEKELAKEVEKRTFELQEANKDLNTLNENLKQFVYIASHDLQEPLRKINMFSDMLKTKSAKSLDESSLNFLSKITNASQRMSNLIKDLLDYSRAEGGEKRFVETDLNKVVKNVIEDYEVLIHQKKAQIKVSPLPVIEAISLQMNQLFYNLIGNALKFSKPDETLLIHIDSRNLKQNEIEQDGNLNPGWNYVEIVISDNGIGFNQKFAEQIFVIFQRLHGKDEIEGTGIGLALCKKIVDNHYGTIFARGEENKGASFHLVLPVKRG